MSVWTNLNEPPDAAELRAADELERVLLEAGAVTEDAEVRDLLAVTQTLQGVVASLPPPSAGLVRRVQRLEFEATQRPRRWRLRPAWAGVGSALAVLIVALLVLTVPGQAAFASLMASLNLGQVQVSVTPDRSPTGPQFAGTRRADLASVDAARALVTYQLMEPASLPAAYALQRVSAVSYEGMPDWFPQPLYIELDYRGPAGGSRTFDLTLRQFGVVLGDGGRIKSLRFDSLDVTETREVAVAGHPALLLTLGPASDDPVRELVWQQEDVMIEILSQTLTPSEMMQVAVSLR